MLGVWKKLLRVNLDKGEITNEVIPEEYFQKYIGGSGLASKYLYDEVPGQTKAFSSENKLIFAVGPFQGTKIPGSAKWSVVSRSPLTKTFAVSTAGAEWGNTFKKSGYDMIIIEGKSKKPVYLWIKNDLVELKSAKNIWGKDALETVNAVKYELTKNSLNNKDISVATIGPAGEKKVGIACITADKHSFAGRCGLGAVMGDKKLKAIAVYGTNKVEVEKKEDLKLLNKKTFKKLSNNAKDNFKAHGTAGDVIACEEGGDLPIKYWTKAKWPEGAKQISAPNFTEKLNAKSWPCIYCPVGCHRYIKTEYKGKQIEGAGAEYESLGLLGSNCLVNDLNAISMANDLCNRLGIDTISAGSFVGFTMECFEKGIISKSDLSGRDASWGNGEFLVELVKEIGSCTGFGALFNNGIKPAAKKIGNGAEALVVEVKNLDFPAHDPRTYFSLAINYATSVRGACHLRGYPHIGELGMVTLPEIGFKEPPERLNMDYKAELAAIFQDLAALHDSLVICVFNPLVGLTLSETVQYYNYVTGFKYTAKQLMEAGDRIVTLQRQINVNDGISRKDDRLPSKMFKPGRDGFRKGKIPEPFEKNLLKFYEYRGWDKNGKPKTTKLDALGIKVK